MIWIQRAVKRALAGLQYPAIQLTMRRIPRKCIKGSSQRGFWIAVVFSVCNTNVLIVEPVVGEQPLVSQGA